LKLEGRTFRRARRQQVEKREIPVDGESWGEEEQQVFSFMWSPCQESDALDLLSGVNMAVEKGTVEKVTEAFSVT